MPEQGEVDITWLGHSTARISLGKTTFLTDPVLRGRVAHLRRHAAEPAISRQDRPDLVLISHHHLDHLDLPSLRRLGPETSVLGPAGTKKALKKAGLFRVEEIRAGETIEVGDVSVRAVPAEHQGRRSPFHDHSEAIGFVMEGERSIYFAGDTDLFDDMASEVGSTDVALLPVWGWGPAVGAGHLDPERAARALVELRPGFAIPIHWGTFFPLGLKRFAGHHLVVPPREFERLAADYAPETEVRVIEPGSSFTLS